MAFPWLGLLLGTAAGVGKHGIDSSIRNKRIKGESERAKWAPWTGHKAEIPEQNNVLGSILQGALAGASFQQGLDGFGKEGVVGGELHYPTPNHYDLGVDYSMPSISSSTRGIASKVRSPNPWSFLAP